MKSAYRKDILQTIKKGRKRFVALMIITVLGVTMFSGLQAACGDLRKSADRFFDQQHLYDLSVVSTLGLTQEDVDALEKLEEVEVAEGIYSETVQAHVGGKNLSIQLQTLSEEGMNEPYILEGHLPEKADEAVVTQKFLDDSGAELGDRFAIEETLEEGDEDTDPEETTFANTEFTICGIIVDVSDVDNPAGATSFRSGTTKNMTVYILPEAADYDIYTGIYITLKDAEEMFCYGTEYEDYVACVKEKIEDEIKAQREKARYNEVTGEAYEELADAEKEVMEELADARQALLDGEQELREKLADAEKELRDGEQEIVDGWKQLKEGEAELSRQAKEAEVAFEDARKQLAAGKTELEENRTALLQALAQIEDGERKIQAGRDELAAQEDLVYAQIETGEKQLEEAMTQAQESADSANAQAEQFAILFGERWPENEWNAAKESLRGTLVYLMRQAENLDEETVEKLASEAAESDQALGTLTVSVYVAAESRIAEIDMEINELQNSSSETVLEGEDESEGEAGSQIAALEEEKEQLKTAESAVPQLAVGAASGEAMVQVLREKQQALKEQRAQADAEFAAARQSLDASASELSQNRAQVEDGLLQIENGIQTLKDSEAELNRQEESANVQIADGRAEIEANRKKLEDAAKVIADGWQEYEDGKQEGEKEISDGWEEYEDGKQEADEKLADARAEIKEIDMATWYVEDRSSLSGYANIRSDADSIDAIGTVFPIVFFIVAILISLTTITRMVEEDRGLIGTYKALGFTNAETRKKYIIYALSASLAGSLIGTLFAFVVLPEIIFIIFRVMYLLPWYDLHFIPVQGLLGPCIFILGIVTATALSCRKELNRVPAVLMRPKAPRAGSRVLLERMKPVWNRLSFLNKVTARNLFRYKKRLLMTIFGIAGCMALLLFGFAIKDSVTDLMPRQYEQTFNYDLMVVSNTEDHLEILADLDKDQNIADYLDVEITSADLQIADGEKASVQLIIVPEGKDLSEYIHMKDLDGNELTLQDGDVYITQNAGSVLGFENGDQITMQLLDLQEAEIPVTELVQNYLGNYVYMTSATFEEYYDVYEANGALLHFSDQCREQVSWADEFSERDGVLSCVSTQELKDQFSTAFVLINMIVYVVIIMSAALAFVVLFTLSTTNISERERELATIKVLGFFDNEVHLYVNKETLILTLIGIVLGVPLGTAFAQTLTVILNLPSIYLAVSLHPVSYLIAAGLSFGFALIVNLIMNRSVNAIDPVEALKSIE
ncbi:MAG: FtsX-like permease family protein [Dorea sp.]